MSGVFVDMNERKWVDKRQSLLLDALNDRVKNMRPIGMSLSACSRLGADMLNQFNALSDVAARTLQPFHLAGSARARVRHGGPVVRLSPNAAVTLNMAFHELATSTSRSGTESVPEGALEVEWTIDRSCQPAVVDLVWRARAGQAATPTARNGFGTKLFVQGVARERDGKVELYYNPTGFAGRIRRPVSQKVMVL